MASYKTTLAAANKVGSAHATDAGVMAQFCSTSLQILVGAASPQLVWEGAQKKGMTAAELARLATVNPAAVHDPMWLWLPEAIPNEGGWAGGCWTDGRGDEVPIVDPPAVVSSPSIEEIQGMKIRNDELTVYRRRTLQAAHTLGALGGCPHHKRLVYQARLEAAGPQVVLAAIERALARRELYVDSPDDPHPPYHSSLEVVDAKDMVITTFVIPTENAFTSWQRALGLELVASECSRCGPPEARRAW